MGVNGLLPALKSVMDRVHISKYTGKIVGIDAAGWLYKGCYSCAREVVLGLPTDSYLNYCIQQIKVLQEHEVTPIFVFDGAPLPAKRELNLERQRHRATWKEKCLEMDGDGKTKEAFAAFAKAVSVSNDMTMELIEVLRRMKIDFVVAPYEADAQLAYLSRTRTVDAVISEDSDTIPYGCKTVLFKWNSDGWATEFKRRSLGANEDFSFMGWTEEMFIQFCVLAGCDYCPSVRGVGIVTAYKLVSQHRTPEEVVKALINQKRNVVSADYKRSFYAAIMTFRHHLVYDLHDKKLKMLTPLVDSKQMVPLFNKNFDFLGDFELAPEIVQAIACGSIHPVTHSSYAWQRVAERCELLLEPKPSARSWTSSESSASMSGNTSFLARSEDSEAVPVERSREQWSAQSRVKDATLAKGTNWAHLDGILGSSAHILNFRSPKVSDNFVPLISRRQPSSNVGPSTTTISCVELDSCRLRTKRVLNASNRISHGERSGFDGELSSKAAVTPKQEISTPATKRSRSFLGPTHEDLQTPRLFEQISRHQTNSQVPGQASPIKSSEEVGSRRTPMSMLRPAPSFSNHSPESIPASNCSRVTLIEAKWDRILRDEVESDAEGCGDEYPTPPSDAEKTEWNR